MKSLTVLTALTVAALLSTAQPAAAAAKTVDQDVSEALRALNVRIQLVEKLGGDALRISVAVSGEKATLTGHVSKAASKGLAEQVALSVDGIKKVDNNVTDNASAGVVDVTEAAVKNVALELKVKSVLLGEIGTNALKIEVEAVDGVVSLRGKPTSPDTAKAAVSKVKASKGVKKVVNLLD